MESGPDGGQLRDDTINTDPGTFDPQNSQPSLNQLQPLDPAQALTLLPPCPLHPADAELTSSLASNLSSYDSVAARAAQPNSPDSNSTPYHDSASIDNHHAQPSPVDAGDLYENNRTPDGSSVPYMIPMAATSSSRPSLRSYDDGAAPKHPTAPACRNLPRSNLRSVSSPQGSRCFTNASAPKIPSGKPSVKDLKKRFDQNVVVGVPTIPPLPSRARTTSSKVPKPSPRGSRALSSHRSSEAAVAETGALDSASLPLRQSRFVADHQAFSSIQSFATRVAKPRNASQIPMLDTSRKFSSHHLHHQVPFVSRGSETRGLLFGEVPPNQHDPSLGGFGIDGVRQRRTSEPSDHITASRQRSLYSPGPESSAPSPPSHLSSPNQPGEELAASPSHPYPRSRSHSDEAGSSPSSRMARNRSSTSSPRSSKLPVSVRKFSTPSNSSSPSPTRSSSPSTLKRHQPNGRLLRASPGAGRAKTPTQGRKSGPTSHRDASLPAYMTVPPSNLSPTLRSSRPRQPVSIASTPTSRMKESEVTSSGKAGELATRRRKVSIGPIDFEQRREHIRLAYTKSIRESEALEASHRAVVDEPGHLIPTPVSDKYTGEDSISPRASVAHPTPHAGDTEPDIPNPSGNDGNGRLVDNSTVLSEKNDKQDHWSDPRSGNAVATPSLTISTEKRPPAAEQDSPTLGLPGSFPDEMSPRMDEGPPSPAVSETSNTTEFDTEPQTNPPVQARSPLDAVEPQSPHKRHPSPGAPTEYRYSQDQESELPVLVAAPSKSSITAIDETLVAVVRPSSDFTHRSEGEGPENDSFPPRHFDIILSTVSQKEYAPREIEKHSIPFPSLDSLYESDCELNLDRRRVADKENHPDQDGVCDTCTGEMDHRKGHEGCQSCHDDLARSCGTSTCAYSEACVYENLQHQEADASSSGKFLMPTSGYEDGKPGRQSAWTDFSVDSTDQSELPRSSEGQGTSESPAFGHVTIFSSHPGSSTHDDDNPGLETRYCSESTQPATDFGPHHLPELDTGVGFSVLYLTRESSDNASYVPSPSHEPPPVPPSIPGSDLNSRTSSAYYEQSQYGSTLLNSERGSDESMSHAGTSRSIDSASLTTTEQYMSTQTPADSDSKSITQDGGELTDKDRQRLIQRRNVIKELLDTEAVFVRDMNIVEEIYKGTAEACPKLDGQTIKLIFRNSDEIIAFHTSFLAELKDAVADVYVPKGSRGAPRDDSTLSSASSTKMAGPSDMKDRSTSLGPVFKSNMEQMKLVHEGFLRASDQAAKRLIQIQQDPTVKVWLNECNEVAKDLTAAWDLDSLLIKPMQRITKYPNLIITLLQYTPQDHPDRETLLGAKDVLETAIIEINKSKKNFELVGQIVGRKRKESDVKAGFARAFGKRVDKLQGSNMRATGDGDYAKLNEKFGDDYLRLQVVLRDVEFYTRQVSAYVHEFLQYMSSIELVMRLQPGSYPELESKWVQFNISVRDLEKVALEEHLSQVRKHVIEPFEHVIKAYGNPSLAMKKRQKRRLDFERSEQLKRSGKSPDSKLKELVEQYDALNDALKKELPQLSALTEKVGNICLGNFVNIQARWYSIWTEKMKVVLSDCSDMPDLKEVLSTFERDFPYANDQLSSIGILNPATWGRTSLSTSVSVDDASFRTRARGSDIESRSRGQSVSGDMAPTLPAPDFGNRRSDSFTMSPNNGATGFASGNMPSPHHYYYRDYYAGIHSCQGGLTSPRSPEFPSSSRSGAGAGVASTRPSTGRSCESGMLRRSSDTAGQNHRDSNATYHSNHAPQETQREPRRFSNMFHSAMPMSDGPDESSSQRQSRASSRERSQTSDGYNVLWLAASLFEFNISTTKHEAGYPYLTYQAGEIFDVIAEKGELWLAKNQDDPNDQVGWIWSKHFAKLADS
ncbi:uncharacterized protein UV8b_02599 [Ustilaginoidea virens]|uniref:DH domain-containing protein n=1 Tax=Ustilaginoidea virens TaxID=1159556 RepID=A0A063C137_USTVR|nr:uncharacterized protein UV8b_02599 [Ustilaginoidea virens]QUC18358.1 hypothetical protein UV8b_02599 [Ustilaginoidea virens]GAO14394.1 hypothetical protein UVI_02055190 [Ustilaginoidea virens]